MNIIWIIMVLTLGQCRNGQAGGCVISMAAEVTEDARSLPEGAEKT